MKLQFNHTYTLDDFTLWNNLKTGDEKAFSILFEKYYADLVRYGKMNFKNDMPVFVRKCPALVKLIQDKIYKRGDIEQIVSFYNANCGN